MKVLVTGGSGFIGTNLTKYFYDNEIDFLNIDLVKPKLSNLDKQWVQCNILDYVKLLETLTDFNPDALVHLAAETDTSPRKTLADYNANVIGTRNVLSAVSQLGISRVIFTSTQFVHQSMKGPAHDEDFVPHTIYGESKMINELDIRKANLQSTWTIIRPTNIWGPWHLRYPYEFWKVLSNGFYFHPGRRPVIRSYGYVGNVVAQIIDILNSQSERVNEKVFYVGDQPIDLYDWVNGFSLLQLGVKVKVMPRFLVRLLAWVGDLFFIVRVKFPITSSRYRSMTSSNVAPMERTFQTFGLPPYSLQEGIAETVDWMRIYFPYLVKTSKS